MISRIQLLEKALDEVLGPSSAAAESFGINKEFLETLCKAFGCEWATFWKVEGYRLRPEVMWNAENQIAEKLNDDTRRRSLSLSEGTAGHVWRSRKPIWSTDIAVDMCLPRSLDASSVGLNGGIWFAVKTDRAVYGVLEMLSQKLEPASEEILLTVEHLGIRLGRLLEQAKALKR